ncbi:hypothetical protein MESMUL_13900 [Mesosutterella multiformis]|uniref:Uncharacterized protein n=1 Tax=Mesosutterella multiformis TaxID=2259133 RepID=A0A388SCT9_9BURK|nr:encapsulin [Mesosutterella multiformis]GBO94036.1 hypothetical protein MESMUL_13900 [Mesosutterella multiformis]
MDFLMRDGAILNPEQWTELDAVVVKTAKTVLTGRKFLDEGEENFVGDSEIIALGGASNETKDRPLG